MRKDKVVLLDALLADNNYLFEDGGVIHKYSSTQKKYVLHKPSIIRGYKSLWYRGHHFYYHQVIFHRFGCPLIAGLCINHMDGDKHNNSISNLEQVTHAENAQHAVRTGLIKRDAWKMSAWGKEVLEKRKKEAAFLASINPKVIEFIDSGCMDICIANRFRTSSARIGQIRGRYFEKV